MYLYQKSIDRSTLRQGFQIPVECHHLLKAMHGGILVLYDYRSQMTGEKVGEAYNAHVVEAHHIIPFTESMNNDTSNIIILSPSYHRIIHQVKPIFDHNKLAFCFPNGLEEKVKLDKHLKTATL